MKNYNITIKQGASKGAFERVYSITAKSETQARKEAMKDFKDHHWCQFNKPRIVSCYEVKSDC